MRAEEIEKWDAQQEERARAEKELGIVSGVEQGNTATNGVEGGLEGSEFVAHVPLPDQKEIEKMVITKKKQDLLSKYMSPEIAKAEQEAKEMLNKKR